ncbi:MAG: DNA polymerase III subunit alpha [Alphaproteobacteria bacterium CG_4_9_14_3_um_filter_47_13]|nr:MAG: DNA polymerase III subunit alpha [Alphaproteobacteria bacterium CG_4_9_14_3_um_filter_47_13]
MPEQQNFIHLHVHSAYSLAEGAMHPKALVDLCQINRMPALAVTDSGNLFGALEFATAAAKGGVQPIIGCQINLGLEAHQLVLLCQSEAGYRNLCKLVSDSFLKVEAAQIPHIDWPQLAGNAEGLICLTGGLAGSVAQYLAHNQPKPAEEVIKKLKKIFRDRLYVEVQRHGLPEEDAVEEALVDLAYKHDIPLVATNDCYFPQRKMHEAHDALLCIAAGRYVIEEDRRKVTPEHYFKSSGEMQALFSDLPEAIHNTLVIARRCSFLLKMIDPILPPFATEGGRTEVEELKIQAQKGLRWRLENFVFTEGLDEDAKKELSKPYEERLQYELDVIIQMAFPGYFLIVSDFIIWAKEQGIPVGPGRGSGAGSVVAWALKITDLDPLQFGLLFERMLNPERVSMPDFDVDFCQERRDEVIRYVQNRYGHDHVAQIITFGKLQARAVVRDVGRVLQMPYGQVDRIAKMIPANPANPISLQDALLQDADLRAEKDKEETSQKLIDIALQLEGLYRHASTHAAGVVIGDRPLHKLLPLYRDPRSDMPVTQFNMKYVEPAGLVKFDFLGLKTLTVIQKALRFVKEVHGTEIDILQIPLDDAKSYELLQAGNTVGVFQLEGAGMRDAMRKMKLNRFEDIIALVALYRPGPMDNIPLYIDCKLGRKEPDYMHPKLRLFLEETYGIMIYQEQVMQAAQALAGYTLGGADLLRRAMGKKIKAEMDAQREMFVAGAKEHSAVPANQANAIFDQIAKFAGYGFNKSHAAAYALIAYQTAWLKANYPVEFMAASMTLDMGNTDKLSIFKQELDFMKIPLLPPDINMSGAAFRVEGKAVRYAFSALKGVGDQAMKNLVQERDENGLYKDLNDFSGRMEFSSMNKRQLERMVCAGVFDSLNTNRAQLHGSVETILRHAQALAAEKSSGQSSLFGGAESSFSDMPELQTIRPWDALETLRHEFDAVGFYLSAHPLDGKAELLARMNIITMAQVDEKLVYQSSVFLDMAGVLIKKQIRVSPKSGNKYAFLQLSDSSGVYEVMVFSELLAAARDILIEGETLLLKVIAEKKEDQTRYTVQDIKPLDESLSKKIQEVRLFLEDEKPATALKNLLAMEGDGRAKIIVCILIAEDRIAEIELQGKWRFSPEMKSHLSRIEGVLEIQEL